MQEAQLTLTLTLPHADSVEEARLTLTLTLPRAGSVEQARQDLGQLKLELLELMETRSGKVSYVTSCLRAATSELSTLLPPATARTSPGRQRSPGHPPGDHKGKRVDTT